jgi:hypothetical protein
MTLFVILCPTLQLFDSKEETYYCHEHAIEYLQTLKSGQRRNCKLLYTHGKEEITAIIKMVNQRLEDDSDQSSSSSDEMVIHRVTEVKQQHLLQQQRMLQRQQQHHSEANNSNKSLTQLPCRYFFVLTRN